MLNYASINKYNRWEKKWLMAKENGIFIELVMRVDIKEDGMIKYGYKDILILG